MIAAPRITVVTFPGELFATTLEQFVAALGTSSYWQTTTAEYGVGAAVAGAPVHLADAAPASTGTAETRAWLKAKIDAGEAGFAGADASSLFVIVYPSTTANDACPAGGYHEDVTSAKGDRVAFSVIPRCNDWQNVYFAGTSLATDEGAALTATLSHELIEAVTDPLPGTTLTDTAWNGLHDRPRFDGEVSDLCSPGSVDPRFLFTPGAELVGESYVLGPNEASFAPADLPFVVQRSWSNRAALAGEDPCQPVQPGATSYFTARPIFPQTITLPNGQKTPGVDLRDGEEHTISLRLDGRGRTDPWDVQVLGNAGGLARLDRARGVSGDELRLTLRDGNGLGSPAGLLYVISSDASRQTISYVYVQTY